MNKYTGTRAPKKNECSITKLIDNFIQAHFRPQKVDTKEASAQRKKMPYDKCTKMIKNASTIYVT